MFTGIVEGIGAVIAVSETGDGSRLVVECGELAELATGASIAVNGACLTSVESNGSVVTMDVVPETLVRTNLAMLQVGDRVNLERPLPANGRFDGHVVQGHIDGVGFVRDIAGEGSGHEMRVEAPETLMPYIVEKGSITIDGVSLTVASTGEGSFNVALIPHTLKVTTLGLRKPGDPVNLETDILAKYVERLLKAKE